MKIKIQLREAVKADAIVERLGLNPWCVAEGADGDDWYEIEVDSIGTLLPEKEGES